MPSTQCPLRTGLPREVVQWLHNLDLSLYLKNVRRDFSNGYHVADIFSRYYPKLFQLHSFENGTSLSVKHENWRRIDKFLQKLNVHLCMGLIHGTIHCEPGAAECLVQEIYTILTKQSTTVFWSRQSDFTDGQYEKFLTTVARPTASGVIKNNLNMTDIKTEADFSTDKKETKDILHRHREHEATERTHCTELCLSSRSQASVPFKEIKVHQPIRRYIQQ